MKTYRTKAWAVTWKNKAMPKYGVLERERILSLEPTPAKRGRYNVRGIYIDALAVFPYRSWAECWREKSEDWEVVRCEITLTPK